MDTSNFVFVISPFSRPDQEKNADYARLVCRRISLETPFIPLASHLICTQYLDDTMPRERELGIRHGGELLKLCSTAFVALPPWRAEFSSGMKADLERASALGLRIIIVMEGGMGVVSPGIFTTVREGITALNRQLLTTESK